MEVAQFRGELSLSRDIAPQTSRKIAAHGKNMRAIWWWPAVQHLPSLGWNRCPTKEWTGPNLCQRHLGLIPTASQFKIEYFAPTNLHCLWFCHHLSDMAEGMTSSTDLRYILYSTCVNGTYMHTLLNLGYGQKPQLRLGEKTPTPNYFAQPRNSYKRSSSRCAQTPSAQQSPAQASEAVREGRKMFPTFCASLVRTWILSLFSPSLTEAYLNSNRWNRDLHPPLKCLFKSLIIKKLEMWECSWDSNETVHQ